MFNFLSTVLIFAMITAFGFLFGCCCGRVRVCFDQERRSASVFSRMLPVAILLVFMVLFTLAALYLTQYSIEIGIILLFIGHISVNTARTIFNRRAKVSSASKIVMTNA